MGNSPKMEATYEPSSMPPIPHLHPSQREHFEILEGTMHARVDGAERELRAGDALDVEAGLGTRCGTRAPSRRGLSGKTRPALAHRGVLRADRGVFGEAQEQGRDPDGAKLAEMSSIQR